MRYPYKLEALIRGEVVKSYNIKPNRGSVDSEDMTSSEEEIEQDMMTASDNPNNIMLGNLQPQDFESVLATDLDEDDGKHGMMSVVRTNSILSEAATKNLLMHQQNSPNNIAMPSGLATVLKKRLTPSNLNLGNIKYVIWFNKSLFYINRYFMNIAKTIIVFFR